MLKILGRATSINVRKVLWTCTELALPFEQEPWGGPDLGLREPRFVALNPNSKIPVLVDGDFVLWESNAICRYLAAREGRDDLLPSAPDRRAHVEQWMDWQTTDLNMAWRYAFLALVRHHPPQPDPAAVAASVEQWNRHMTILDGQLAATGAYVAGDAFTLADVVVALSTHRWLKTPIARAELPAVAAWFHRLRERPSFAVESARWGDAP